MAVEDTDVLVVGDANLDLIASGDVVPRFGQQEQLLTDARLVLGGSAGITACALAKLGMRVTIAASVGADPFGDVVRDQLAGQGVDVSRLAVTPDRSTGLTIILDGPERAILTHQGAMTELHPLVSGADRLPPARHVHVSGLFLQPALARAVPSLFARARAEGMTTSLDTNWDPSGEWSSALAALPHTVLLLPNERELLALAGIAGDPGQHSVREEASTRLTDRGCVVALKRGSAGGEVWGPDGTHLSAPGLPVKVVDTVGAGDTFNAGFLSGYLRGESSQGCLDRAVACGSLSTRGLGGTAAQPTETELRHVLRRTA
jgi:ribokinase